MRGTKAKKLRRFFKKYMKFLNLDLTPTEKYSNPYANAWRDYKKAMK